MDFTPLINKIARRIRPNVDIGTLAEKSWEIAPAEQVNPPAAIYFDEDIAKITRVPMGTNLKAELKTISSEPVIHSATKAHRINGAKLIDGTLYTRRYSQKLVNRRSKLVALGGIQEHPASVLSASWCGNAYFGDWLLHDLSMNLLAQELGQPIENNRKQWTHEQYYREKVSYVSTMIDDVWFSKLTVVDDLGNNAHKRARYARIRAKLRETKAANPGSRYFLKRGTSGSKRTLINEDEVELVLLARGFKTLVPEQLSAATLAETILDASIIVGIEGSQLSHAVYSLQQGGALLAIQPPDRFNACLKPSLDAQYADLRYAFIVGSPKETRREFHIDVDKLERLLDKL